MKFVIANYMQISAKKIGENRMSAAESSAYQQAQTMRNDVDRMAHDALKPGEDSYTGLHFKKSNSTGKYDNVDGPVGSGSVYVDTEKSQTTVCRMHHLPDGQFEVLNSRYEAHEASGVRSLVANTLMVTGLELYHFAEASVLESMTGAPAPVRRKIQGSAAALGEKLEGWGRSLSHTKGPEELHISRQLGEDLFCATFHTDGSLNFESHRVGDFLDRDEAVRMSQT